MSFNPRFEQGHFNQQATSSDSPLILGGTRSSFSAKDSSHSTTEPVTGNSYKRVGLEPIQSSDFLTKTTQPVDLSSTHPRSIQLLSNPLSSTSIPPIYLTLNTAGTVLAVNPDGAASLGHTAESLIGQSVMAVVHPQDQIRLRTELLMLPVAQPVKQGEFCLVSREGKLVPQVITVQAFQTSDGSGTLLICNSLEPQTSQKIYRLEQAQAEQVLRQQTEWEKLMQSIAQPARQSLELRFIMRAIAVQVRQLLQADRVLFYQAHPNETGNILAEAVTPDCSSILDYADATAILQQRYMRFQAPDLDLNLQQNFQRHLQLSSLSLKPDVTTVPPSTEQFGAQAEIVVPIVEQDTLWGLLVVHQCQRSRQWQLWELGLLKQLATYLNSVIQQAELYQKVQRLNADLERQIQARTAELQLAFDFEATLKRITDNVRDSLNEDEILETVVQELACAIGTSGCNASIYDLEAGTSTICYEYTTILSAYQGRVVQLDASPEIYNQLLEGQAFQFCSLNINPTRGKVSMLTCPIVDDQGVLGDLWLINHPFYCFTAQDIRLVQQVANQCAIAIRQARLYQAAQAQVKELERLNQLKDDFLSTVSHELRTPMANIKMATQMLEVVLKQTGLLAKENDLRAAKYFQILQTECQREINLINDLLDLSRLDMEQASLQLDTIDLPTWLTSIVRPFLSRTQEQQQHLQLDYLPHLPHLTTNLPGLDRIVTELLQNACKYTPSGQAITVSARLSEAGEETLCRSCLHPSSQLTAQSSVSTLRLSVTNSGVEIPPMELSRVFEKFYRIPNNDPWQHGGTGLGLALVKKLSERLGGSVWAESGSGQTRFTVELPLICNE